jgi:ATP/maltotriose-dependent transcriptional regulator MalT
LFTPLIRFTLLLLCTIIAVIATLTGKMPIVIIATLCSLFLLWGYYSVGTVYLALHRLRKGNFEDAARIIELTRKPEKLSKTKKAYYYYIKAYIAREKDDFSTAKNLFNLAINEGLKEEHDRAIAYLALADIAVIQGDKDEARKCVEHMKGLKVREALMPEIRKMQQFLGV